MDGCAVSGAPMSESARHEEAYKDRGGMVPANLTIRVSATMVDGNATRAWPTTSGVHTVATKGLRVCPAPTQGNKCAI